MNFPLCVVVRNAHISATLAATGWLHHRVPIPDEHRTDMHSQTHAHMHMRDGYTNIKIVHNGTLFWTLGEIFKTHTLMCAHRTQCHSAILPFDSIVT